MKTVSPSKDSHLPQLAEFLDAKFRGPFGLRFGWNGILSMIPGIGDTLTSGLTFYILFRAMMIGCPPSVLLRMTFNALVETSLDFVPGLGFISDFAWKANIRNVRLIDAYIASPRQVLIRSRWSIALILILFFIFASVVVFCGILLLRELIDFAMSYPSWNRPGTFL